VSDSTPKIDRFCVRCKSQISERRVARVSCFCFDECRRQDRIERATSASREILPALSQRASAQKDSRQ
jgi:hypothetical protein